jgi:hypothetical protein
MKLRTVIMLLSSVLMFSGCSEKNITDDELIASLKAAGYTVVKEAKIHHSLEGAQKAFWINIDGKRISAYQFDTVARAKLMGRTFKNGLYNGFWAFEFVDELTAEKIQKALNNR